MYRAAPKSEWQSIKQLTLNAYGSEEEAFAQIEPLVYVKFPHLSYPTRPYSFGELAH
jgi:hypothetical protein